MVLAALAFGIFLYNPKLIILPNPGEAELTIDGQPVVAGVPLKLTPGTYLIRAAADGYLAEEETITLRATEIRNLTLTLRSIPPVRSLQGGVAFPAMNPDQKTIAYLGTSNTQFFRVATELGGDGTAQIQAISDSRFQDISRVSWSPSRALAVIERSTGKTSLFDFARYDFTTQEEKDLPARIRAVAWHPTEPTLVFYINDPNGEQSLVRYQIETGATERLIDLRDQAFANPELAWSPDGRTILLTENSLALFDIQTRTIRRLPGSETARHASWNPVSGQILAELADGLTLFATDSKGSGGRLSLQTPLAKTTWTNDGSAIIVATSTDRGVDQLIAINANSLTRTTYRYLADSPISIDQLLVTDTLDQLWLISHNTLFHVVLAVDEE